MKRLEVIVSTCILVLLAIVACSAPNRSSGAEANAIAPEIPAPVQQTGKSYVYNFDTDTTGQLPAKFHAGLTGKGTAGAWAVKADSTAP